MLSPKVAMETRGAGLIDTDRNGRDLSAFRESSVFGAFEEIVRQQPEKVAIEESGEALCYADLRMQSIRICRALLEVTTEPGRVALLFSKRSGAMASMLGVLRAGHAFVPVDPDDPEERIRFILADSEPCALLTDSENYGRAKSVAASGWAVIDIEQLSSRFESPRFTPIFAADRLAYLFYTSGSTGEPKGVMQTQRNLLYFVRAYSKTLGLTSSDRLTLLYSLSFSAANMDIFGGLLAGATICAFDVRRNGVRELKAWLGRGRITVLHTVPTVFRALVANANPEDFRLVRAIDLGGETVVANDVALFRKMFRPDCMLVNHLAATEASVIAQHVVDPTNEYQNEVPVGCSPQGMKVEITTEDESRPGPGRIGRLMMSSPYLSPGYWRRPELNHAAFGTDPSTGWRLFYSQDIGRRGEDGLLYFVGRDEGRVKVRGHTLDIAEVEAALRRCQGVMDAAVIAIPLSDRNERVSLTAFVISEAGEREPATIRRHLAAFLPSYMQPSSLVFVDALPTTASGKIDKRALAKYRVPATTLDCPDPANPFEVGVAQIFGELLRCPQIGRGTDFFFDGGDSMMLPELQILLSSLVGRDVSLREILDDPTVAGLADTLARLAGEAEKDSTVSSLLIPLRESVTGPVFFLIHGLLGQAHVGPRLVELTGKDQPICAVQARGLNPGETPNETIEAMAADYLDAIRARQPSGPYFLGGLCAGGYIALVMAQILRDAGEEVLPVLLVDPPVPPLGKRLLALDTIDERLDLRAKQGRFRESAALPERRMAARRVAVAFGDALRKFQPKPYPGPVYLLANTRRFAPRRWNNPAKFRQCFAGPVEFFEVAETHAEIFDVSNEAFATVFSQCVNRIRGMAGDLRELELTK